MFGVLVILFSVVGLTACGLGMAAELGAEITSDLLWRIFFWCLVGLGGSILWLWLSEVMEVHFEIRKKSKGA